LRGELNDKRSAVQNAKDELKPQRQAECKAARKQRVSEFKATLEGLLQLRPLLLT